MFSQAVASNPDCVTIITTFDLFEALFFYISHANASCLPCLFHRTDKEEIIGADRTVKPTDSFVAKAGPADPDAAESIFSAQCLPCEFYSDIVKAFSGKAVLDLSIGQGQAALSCLQNRICYVGFGLTEKHCEALKKRLTQKVLEEMKQESSTFYRPELVTTNEGQTGTDTGKGPKRPGGNDGKPEPKKPKGGPKPKPQNQKPEKSEKDSNKGEEAKEDDDDRRSDSLPW